MTDLSKSVLAWAICWWGAFAFGQTNFAVLTADGAWTWFNDPRALYHNGILYFGYVRSSDGRSALGAFNPQTGLSTNLWSSALTQKDDHNNPGLLVKQDGRLLAIHSRHGSDQFFSYRLSLTTNPVSSAAWGNEQTIGATGAGVTYANPYQLSGENGLIYNFMRDLNFNPTVILSTNGGTNWGSAQLFIQTGTGSIRPYVKYCSNYTNRIDFLYTDGHPRDVNNSLYHLYYQGGNLYKTDGTLVKSFASIPLLHDSGERGSVIYQYSAVNSADPNDYIPSGRAWCWETTYQSNGAPVCVFTVQRDKVAGTNWFDDRIYYYYARWMGTNWQKRFIAQAGRPLYNGENDYAGGICIDPENPNVIYLSSNAADPFNLSSISNVVLRANDRYEIYKGQTSDGGLSFTWQAVTTNSTLDNLRPYIPRRHGGARSVIWFQGIYGSYTAYNSAVVGLFPNPVPQPPSVSITNPAGRPVIVTNQNSRLKLGAAASDDGFPAPLGFTWTTVSGPTNAIFSAPTNNETTARFALPGSYVLRVTASDTALSDSDEVTVQVGNPSAGPDPSVGLWLKLDETSGSVAGDSSGNGNNGTLSSGATWLPNSGQQGGALDFDGVSGEAVVNDANSLDATTAFTLAYWFRADNYPGDSAGLVCKRDGINVQNAFTTYLKAADKHIYVDVDSSNNRFASLSLIDLGKWYHVALVFDGSLPVAERAKLWLNGVLDVTATETSSVITNYTSAVRIGNTHPGAVNWFDGRVDDVRFYRRALGVGEIAFLSTTNFAPTVSAGAAPLATNGVAAGLGGSVTDDGRGGPLRIAWGKVSGPGQANFAALTNPATSVTFNQAGAYTLSLAASDTQMEVSDELSINVAPNQNIYEDWIALAFVGVTNLAVTGISADPDNDGVKNLVEFALGTNPNFADAHSFGPGQGGLPLAILLTLSGTNYLGMRVQRPVGRMGIQYSAEVSADFNGWSPALEVGGPVANGDGTEVATFRDFQPAWQASLRVMRLKITKL